MPRVLVFWKDSAQEPFRESWRTGLQVLTTDACVLGTRGPFCPIFNTCRIPEVRSQANQLSMNLISGSALGANAHRAARRQGSQPSVPSTPELLALSSIALVSSWQWHSPQSLLILPANSEPRYETGSADKGELFGCANWFIQRRHYLFPHSGDFSDRLAGFPSLAVLTSEESPTGLLTAGSSCLLEEDVKYYQE